jgi:hypothetical protein
MKTLQIIETPDYILGVSNDEPKPKDLVLLDGTIMHIVTDSDKIVEYHREYNKVNKIIAHIPKGNIPELDLPLLPEMVVEDDVEKLAKEYSENKSSSDVFKEQHRVDFIAGYNAATKVSSEYDTNHLKWIFNRMIYVHGENEHYDYMLKFKEIIQSLKQPKSKYFIAEMETYNDCINHQGQHLNPNCPNCCYNYKLKTTSINGKVYLVGTYK